MIEKPPPTGPDVPHGFRPTESGLIVPEAFSRQREVWTDDEVKLMLRATKLLNRTGWSLTFGCPHPRCQENQLVRREEIPGGFQLVCEHKVVVCISLKTHSRRR